MGIKVAKFGGSSVADGIQLTKTKQIIEQDPDRRYVVVSAPGKRYESDNKITDILYLCKTHIEHNLPYDQLFQVVADRFMAVQINLGVKVDLLRYFDEIRENLKQNPSADYIASRGEYLNAVLVAAFLGYDFVDTKDLIKFDAKGKLLMTETDEAIRAELEKHERAVLPGFYGSLPDGSVKTFSRGGSDITGALVARAMEADVYENWTDVSGFLMADPRIVKNPQQIRKISYKELRELSYMGASVLHEDAIYPARMANVPINIRNTNAPEDPGTMITGEAEAYSDEGENRIITGIAGSKDFTVVALYKNMMSSERGFVRRILGILDDYDINFEHLPSGIDTVSVVMSNQAINGRIDEVLDEFRTRLRPDSVDVFENMALVATVGHGMSFRPGVSAKLFTALAEAGVNIRMIDQGSSEMNIIVGVENKEGSEDRTEVAARTTVATPEQIVPKIEKPVVEAPKTEPTEEVEHKIFTVAEQMPSFKGNVNAWLSSHLQYPAVAAENGIQGRVIVKFVVGRDGSVSQAQVLRGVDPSLDREALRVVNSMPKWKPAEKKGRPVQSRASLTIVFQA